MTKLSERHSVHATLGRGKCSIPMWTGTGLDAGLCDAASYGMQTEDGKARTSRRCGGLACPHHGGPKLLDVITGRIVIRFDGPPSHESGRFIEVERDGASISFGEWVEDSKGEWLLVLPPDVGRLGEAT